MSPLRHLLLPSLLLSLACDNVEDLGRDDAGVGHSAFELEVGDGRLLPVEVWYPARVDESGSLLDEFFQASPDRANALTELFDVAPADCVRRESLAVEDAVADGGTHAVVIASHCHECIRQEFASTAEALAREGIVVVAPEHDGNTLYDELEGGEDLLGGDFLQTRAADVSAVLDHLAATSVVPGLELDLDRVGVLGHSFGAATAGLVLQQDDRFSAGMAIAAPFESPVLPGVSIDQIDEPVLWLLAQEDNSITELGNQLIRMNHEALPGPSWLVEVADAGHWSFSDIAGLTDAFAAGCGQGTRQTDPGTPFTYADNDAARELAATLAVAFFRGQLLDDQAAADSLTDETALESSGLSVTVDARP